MLSSKVEWRRAPVKHSATMLENSLKQDRLLRHAVLYDRQCMAYGWMQDHMNCYTYTLLQKGCSYNKQCS